jgi:hypothetical protein
MIIKRIKKSSKKILLIFLKVAISSQLLLVNDDPIYEGINGKNQNHWNQNGSNRFFQLDEFSYFLIVFFRQMYC